MPDLPLTDPASPGRVLTPALTSPSAYLLWLGRQQWPLILGATACGVAGAVAQAVSPYLLGRAVDSGLGAGVGPELLRWCAALLAVGTVLVVANVIGHRLDVFAWMRGSLATARLVGHHVSGTGAAIRTELPTGEVVATVASDALRIGEVYAFAGRVLGGLAAYAVVATMLLRASTPLGVAAAVGVPAVAAVLALLVRPLHHRQAAQREANGRLTTLGSDTVSGLRVLRGIGGEHVFTARYRDQSQKVRRAGEQVAQTQSLLDAMQALLPGLLLAAVVWFGARLALAGDITPGQLVTFYGMAAFLTQPLQAATQAVHILTRARVAAAKVIRVLRVRPDVAGPANPEDAPALGSVLRDESSGFELAPGLMTALVAADPDASAAVATRLGRFDDAAERAHPVLWGAAPLARRTVDAIRERIVVSEATPHLFTGTLTEELSVREGAGEADLLAALETADAHDVLDSLAGGLRGEITEKGRSLSGGQRQRVALARALLTQAEVLVLIEPTSAVDAHTEARIAARVARARRGRTTLVVTASPLVLDHVDVVALLVDGAVEATGAHRGLLATSERYRAIVTRSETEPGAR